MPLHGEHKVFGIGSFDSFNDSVVGATRRNLSSNFPIASADW
jgi:hypothetical protein